MGFLDDVIMTPERGSGIISAQELMVRGDQLDCSPYILVYMLIRANKHMVLALHTITAGLWDTSGMNESTERKEYSTYKKPSWAPPGWLFGPVWTFLYLLIALSFGTVFYQTFTGGLAWIVALPFALNLIFNASFTPIQFGLKNNYLAAVDIVLVLATLLWSMYVIYPLIPWVALINIPYLLWVSFATVLQFSVTYLNR